MQEHGLQLLQENEEDAGHGGVSSGARGPSSHDSSTASNQPTTPMNIKKHTLSLRQVYVTTWSVLCFLGMAGIAGAFIVQRINDEVKMASPFGDKPALSDSGILSSSPSNSSSSMSKMTAMLLCFMYAALAWLMSNGIVANPRMGMSVVGVS
jgi:hypothetical protein